MHKGMLPVPGVVRRLVPALAAAAVVAGPLLPATAQAQEPAGSTVRGELVQAWPEVAHDPAAGHVETVRPLTWVQTADGESVRIPTEDAAGLTVGSTVQVTVGDEVRDPGTVEGLPPARQVLGGRVVAPRGNGLAPRTRRSSPCMRGSAACPRSSGACLKSS